MSAPPRLNLLGEILLIRVLVRWSKYLIGVIVLISFLSAGYRLYLFSLRQHGVYLNSKRGFNSGSVMEYLVCRAHWAPVNLVILCVVWLVC